MASMNSRNSRGSSVAQKVQSFATSAIASVTPANTFTRVAGHNTRTHEGGRAMQISSEEELRRSVLACMLWENSFYESGNATAQRIRELIPSVAPEKVAQIAYEARNAMKLRHVPLFIAVEMLKHPEHKKLVRALTPQIVKRADEMAEMLSMYWGNDLEVKRDNENQYISQRAQKKIPMQLQRGLQLAFRNFDDYQITKYMGNDKPVKMADVIRIVHPDPKKVVLSDWKKNVDMAEVYKSVVQKTAKAPEDTWEVALSAGGKEAKRSVFEDLLSRGKLPAMALLRNLRGMKEAGVGDSFVQKGLQTMNVERILPYRFISARKFAPHLQSDLEQAMYKCLEGFDKLPGKTVFLVDVSGSMTSRISGKSDLSRADAAAALAMLGREICESSEVYLFDTSTRKVGSSQNNRWPSRETACSSDARGFKLADGITSAVGGGTDIRQAVDYVNSLEKYDRLIMFTDEQSMTVPGAPTSRGYVINVATNENGVGYGEWLHINGFSENTLRYIQEYEAFEEHRASIS